MVELCSSKQKKLISRNLKRVSSKVLIKRRLFFKRLYIFNYSHNIPTSWKQLIENYRCHLMSCPVKLKEDHNEKMGLLFVFVISTIWMMGKDYIVHSPHPVMSFSCWTKSLITFLLWFLWISRFLAEIKVRKLGRCIVFTDQNIRESPLIITF